MELIGNGEGGGSEGSRVGPLVRKNLADQAYEELHRAITSGALLPGQRMSDAALAIQLGVSRGPVREAIARLESSGLVVSQAGRGWSVVEFSDDDVEEIYTLRAAMEAFAAERAADRITPEQLADLDRLLAGMGQSSSAGAWRDVLMLDMQFHEAVVRAAEHRRLLHAWQQLRDQIALVAELTARELYRDLRDIQLRHKPIVDAIRAGDGAAAARAGRQHVLEVHDLLMQRRQDATLGRA